ncbi:class F sortase [Arthrobacter sp. NPDC092385]|uniref:class F sortase n=1 Tax=Arthrobacter sp. NPDC092385 TaxID=3363943 RepID=UPI003820718B
MIGPRSDGGRLSLVSAAVTLLILTGCANAPAETGIGASGGASPSASGQAYPEADGSAAPPQVAASDLPAVLTESPPLSFAIPSTGASSKVLSTGLRENGTLEVPPDGPGAPASWYNQSPTPGERGPAVFLGHVNATDGGPGVFADLRALRAGDTIEVLRDDGTTAVFAVDHAEQYPKDSFPTATVYGNTEGSELRLITCDGYDPDTGEFDDNYVVYAKLVT